MRYLLSLLLVFNLLNGQSSNKEGFIIYEVSLTEMYNYSEDLKVEAPESYARRLATDSLINKIQLGVAFKDNLSNSFRLKEFTEGANNEYSALHKVNGHQDYHYNHKDKTSNIYLNYWMTSLTINVSLESKWNIDYNKTKVIDGRKCYYAVYISKGLWWKHENKDDINAWFTPEISLPYGPLHYNNLPGLILELNYENIRYTASKISFSDKYSSTIHKLDTERYDQYSEDEFIKNRRSLRKKAKRLMTGN